MKRIGFCGLVMLCLTGMALARGSAEITAVQIADKLDSSAKTVTYAAVRMVTFHTPGGVKTFEERVLRSAGKVYASYPSGSEFADQQIFEKGGKRYTYNVKTKELRVAPAKGGFIETAEMLRKANATAPVAVKTGEAIAGRPTYYLEVKMGGRGRGGGGIHRMWIDKEKFVLLKRSFGANSNEEMGGFEITQIDYKARIPSSKFDWPKGAKLITVQDDVRRLAGELGLKAMMLTKSGKLELISTGKMEFQGRNILRQFYTDGDKRLSLFIMKETDAQIRLQGDRVKSYRWNKGGMTLILLGDYTESELKTLSQSVKS